MKRSNLSKIIAALGGVALMSWAGAASALEGPAPYLPGVSIGAASGALPPPGFYGVDQNVILTGPGTDNNGNNTPVNLKTYLNIPTVIWSPNLQLLGAQFSTALTQPYVVQGIDLNNVGLKNALSYGMFNTIISPFNLSWNLGNGLFVKTGLGIYIPDGYYQNINVPGGKAIAPNSIANNFWTFEPDFGISFLSGGLQLTAHAVFDFNTKNTDTNYSSGDVFYLDLTAAQNVGKWTLGGGFNFSQQFTKDSGFGAPSNGKELQYVGIGPLVAYDFGPVVVTAKYIFGVEAKNNIDLTQFYLNIFAPF